ncbi:glycoside hydrolase [Bacillus sp. FJAT-27225]|uniref:beta-N-acetylhexosaminidase n=1 Tax=Bacillus sp. FJAT-27225 TaxID=1743144 RepID=UPI00080C3131|nr:beta-N-acetylhexosaminidase [Bacillus sp. FJAT-27225]OCA85998.1 glycoside hydrolase [Bacillus sp. FJAT-27225]
MKINFTGDTAELSEGLKLIADEMDLQLTNNGYPIHITKKAVGNLEVKNENGKGSIIYKEKIHFFRALGLWIENYTKLGDFDITESPQFDMNGAMLDASRNGVLSVPSIQDLLRKMAIMGLNVLMVYTEDTYEVEDYPYFGYMRGRYTEKEIETCDQYASALGIEMIPCIQTLAHLTEALKWNYAANIRDTADILLVGEPETYKFIEKIITAATRPFKTNRIHIGMDEAFQLGLGKYLSRNGYEERFNIMNGHLKKVISITEEKGLKPMIWSDMYFRLGSKSGGYYDLEAEIPEEVISSIPNTQLVYWDYYHADEDFYRTFIQKHKELGSNPIFAGGVWTWNGIAPNYGKAMVTSEAALMACKKEGVREVFATMWGDNGAETPLVTALPVLQLFAEHSYHKTVTREHLEARFNYCTGGNFSDFMILNEFDETPGVSKDNLHESNPSKFLLWQDLLIGLYDENIRGLSMNQHYKGLTSQLDSAKQNNQEWKLMFDFYEQLAKVLSIKSEMGINLKKSYEVDDKETVNSYLMELIELKDMTNDLRQKHRKLWFSMNKPFGWEVIDLRYGGLMARIETAKHRVQEWLEGTISTIEELEEERLHFEGPYPMPEGSIGRNIYRRIVTAGTLT